MKKFIEKIMSFIFGEDEKKLIKTHKGENHVSIKR